MATYYCDPSGEFSAADDGTDNSGSEWLGPYGLQTGLDTVTSGNDLHILGGSGGIDCNLMRLVAINVGDDRTSTWVAGDAVRNNTGSGDDWTGVLCEITTTTMLIETSTTTDYDDVATADGIENTTRSETTTISSKSLPGLDEDTNSGTNTALIHVVGTDASWTAEAGECLIDGGSTVANGININARTYKRYYSLHFENFTNSGMRRSGGSPSYCMFRNIKCISTGTYGLHWFSVTYCYFEHIKVVGHTGTGIYFSSQNNHVDRAFIDGGSIGTLVQLSGVLTNSVIINSSSRGVEIANNNTTVLNNVVDSCSDGILINSTRYKCLMLYNRITNNSAYGINDNSGIPLTNYENYNYFEDNTSGNRNNIAAGPDSDSDNADTNEGYIDPSTDNYSTADAASMRKVAVDLDW